MPRQKTWSITLTCVGLQFRWKLDGRETLARSVPFKATLVREPDNSRDENAVQVTIASDFKLTALRDRQLGYLRKEVAAMLAPKLDAGTLQVVKLWVTDIDAKAGEATVEARFRDLAKKT